MFFPFVFWEKEKKKEVTTTRNHVRGTATGSETTATWVRALTPGQAEDVFARQGTPVLTVFGGGVTPLECLVRTDEDGQVELVPETSPRLWPASSSNVRPDLTPLIFFSLPRPLNATPAPTT